jgi:hypothetical protein
MAKGQSGGQKSVGTFDEALRKVVTPQRLAIVMAAITIFLLFRPLFLPIKIGFQTTDFYNRLEALKPGDIVVYSTDTVPGDFLGGRRDIYKAVINHLIEKQVKIIFHPTAAGWSGVTETIKKITNIGTLTYGTDYVFLPFVSGEEMAWASFAADMKGFYKTDIYGASLTTLPIFANVNSMSDVDLAVVQYGIFTWGEMFVRQWPTKYGVPMICMALFSTLQAWYGNQVKGNLDLDLGFAEYEALRKLPAEHILRMEARNVVSLMIIAMIFVGTGLYWATGVRRGARTSMGV